MKNNKITIVLMILAISISCTDLDLVPLDQPTNAPFTTRKQFREALNEGYRTIWFPLDGPLTGSDADDDANRRDGLSSIKAGTLEASNGTVADRWSQQYKFIARMLAAKSQILEAGQGLLNDEDIQSFSGEVDFFLATGWSYLITHFGDVPFYEEALTPEEAFAIEGRTDKMEILTKVYDLYDNAIAKLPMDYTGTQFITKGAAMAMKARVALYMGDYAMAKEAAEACMDLGIYSLHADYRDLFVSETRTSDELIFYMPRSVDFDITTGDEVWWLPRTQGGWAGSGPTWSLLAAYECTDGLPIDESPLFDRENPFKNRDPRCAATIVPFGSLEEGDTLTPKDGFQFLNVEYTPHPERTKVMNFKTGAMVKNNDSKSGNQFSNFQGLLFRKFVSEDWIDDDRDGQNNHIIMRYADVLLMYAEAKIELNQIDESVLDAINEVRTRAYAGSGIDAPLITTMDQDALRKKVRLERRVEFVKEGLRYMDLVRWRLAEKVFSMPLVGIQQGTDLFDTDGDGNITVKPGLWFWSEVPEIDEDGIADFQPLIEAGTGRILNTMDYPVRQYLFPIPSEEVLLAPSLLPNNPGY